MWRKFNKRGVLAQVINERGDRRRETDRLAKVPPEVIHGISLAHELSCHGGHGACCGMERT